VILLHVGGASTASILVSVFVIFFLIFAVSFAFGKIPEGQSRFSAEWFAAWFKASLPRLLVAGAFATILGLAGIFLGDDPGSDDNSVSAASCESSIPPLTGNPITDDRLLAAIDGWEQVADAADSGDVARVQTLYVTTDAHNVTHDIDRPLREADPDLAMDLCLAVVVIENQMATDLDAEVIAREATRVAGFLQEARAIPELAAPAPTASGGGACGQPIGAVTTQQLTTQRFDSAIADMRQVAEQAETAPQDQLSTLFFGDAHNITHDVDGPLREADEQLALDLCESVLTLERQVGNAFDRAVIAEEASRSADLLEEAASALGVTD
jgi:hypothetical protein